jgi:endogenous inhibitor of DNA gyrase (YacG/DUF329 family)
VFLGEPEFPFCSDRCRLIDLGNWSSEEYRISEPLKDFEIEEKPHREERRRDD